MRSDIGGPLVTQRRTDWATKFRLAHEVLRGLARDAGVHIYCDTNDVISACPGFLSIHATRAREKTLTFAHDVRLRDLCSGEELTSARNRCSFSMVKGETRLFSLE